MNSKTIANGILRAVGVLAAIVLVLLFLYKIQTVIAYIIIAVVISLIGRPLVLFFRNKLKFNNTIASVVTIFILLIVLLGIIGMFIPLILTQGHNLSLLDIHSLSQNLQLLYVEIANYVGMKPADVQQQIENSDLLSQLDFSAIPDFLNWLVSTLGSFSAGLFSVIFISFFFLKDNKLFEHGIMIFIPDSRENHVSRSFSTIKSLLSRYFIGLLMQILILFVIYTIVLLIFGVPNAIVIAFLCALLNLIPYVGPLIGGGLMIMLTMTSNLGADFSTIILPKTIYVLIGFIIGQLVDNFFSQPFIFSNSVKSHPLEIFLVIIIGGMLFGVLGMIIAVPAYTVLKVIGKEFFSENKIVKSLTKNL
ncbi:AI-2E family transporter [Zhouia sp. PK063]|uniref:AI-2E family transporter n=1 Tax=Zhouia sp. PK063 TaxID=3373602 RepID=UPI0037A33C91